MYGFITALAMLELVLIDSVNNFVFEVRNPMKHPLRIDVSTKNDRT